jgi:Carboxypeptidase regulatory-like domain/TonB-dependent Receptor Plug Domain/TonB dependent receptor
MRRSSLMLARAGIRSGHIALKQLTPSAVFVCGWNSAERRLLSKSRRGVMRAGSGFMVVATLCLSFALRAQAGGQTGLLDGLVRSAPTQQPLAGAMVRVGGTGLATVSGADGRFRLRAPVGVVRLEVRAIGFAPIVRSDVVVSAGKPTTVVIDLQPRVVQLSTVDVQPSYFEPASAAAVSTQRFSAEEVRRTPGVQEDVIRAVSVLPGVAVTTAGRNDLVVRGGAPFENLFVVDNVEVPNLNHFGTQGSTGGPVSLIPIEFVQDAALSAGGFGVRYGDRTSSVTTIALREGNRARRATTLNLSALGVGAIAEGPLPNGGSLLVSARRSYLDFVFNAVGFPFIPSYTDVTLKAVQRPTVRDELAFLLLGARDRIRFKSETADNRFDNSTVLGSSQDQYVAGVTWKRLLPSGVLTTTLGRTWSRFDAAQRDSSNPPQATFVARSTEGETSLRSDLSVELSSRTTLTAGLIAKYASALTYDITLPGAARRDQDGVPRALDVDTAFRAFRQAAYAQTDLQVADHLRLTLGIRGDWYQFLRNAMRIARAVGTIRRHRRSGCSETRRTRGRCGRSAWIRWWPGGSDSCVRISSSRSKGISNSTATTPDVSSVRAPCCSRLDSMTSPTTFRLDSNHSAERQLASCGVPKFCFRSV